VYDCDVEDEAYESARHCNRTASSGYNENVHVFKGDISNVDIVFEACKSWYNEASKLKEGNINKSKDNTSNIANGMVRDTNAKLGCAVVKCPSETHVVCHYTPKEKADGEKI
ncbi:hypothetical protein ANCDUO_18305, partial [Ancylostoma duodenale]